MTTKQSHDSDRLIDTLEAQQITANLLKRGEEEAETLKVATMGCDLIIALTSATLGPLQSESPSSNRPRPLRAKLNLGGQRVQLPDGAIVEVQTHLVGYGVRVTNILFGRYATNAKGKDYFQVSAWLWAINESQPINVIKIDETSGRDSIRAQLGDGDYTARHHELHSEDLHGLGLLLLRPGDGAPDEALTNQ